MGFLKFSTLETLAFTSDVANIEYVPEALHISNVDYGKKLISEIERITPLKTDPSRYLYIRNHAISSLEEFGYNQNRDAWGIDELRLSGPTFVGSPVCANHINDNPDKYYGFIPDSAFLWSEANKNDWYDTADYQAKFYSPHYKYSDKSGWLENILVIDKALIEADYPGIIESIANDEIIGTSMGSLSGYSKCSICGKIAKNVSEYCNHIKLLRQYNTAASDNVFEINYENTFFEDSIITTNTHADNNAIILSKYAATQLNITQDNLQNRVLINTAIAKRRNIIMPWISTKGDIIKDEKEIENYCNIIVAEKKAIEEHMVGGKQKGTYDLGISEQIKNIPHPEKSRAEMHKQVFKSKCGHIQEIINTVQDLNIKVKTYAENYIDTENSDEMVLNTDLTQVPRSVRDNSEMLENVTDKNEDDKINFEDYNPPIQWIIDNENTQNSVGGEV